MKIKYDENEVPTMFIKWCKDWRQENVFFLESIGNTIEPVFKPSHTLYEILKYALLSTNYYYKSIKQV